MTIKERIVEMAKDKDLTVAVKAIKVAALLAKFVQHS